MPPLAHHRMPFDVLRFARERAERGVTLGEPCAWPAETGSTNDDALAAARAGAPHGALFGAEAQTNGRGRRGSEWWAEPGAGLLFSVVLRLGWKAELAPSLALIAGLSVRKVVAGRIGAPALVKWPNDVLVDERKISGVLVESQLRSGTLGAAVVGIGLNVETDHFPPAIEARATSLRRLGATLLAREMLLAELLRELEVRLALVQEHGIAAIISELSTHDALSGRSIRVDGQSGRASGIDDSGRLRLVMDDGRTVALSSGHVEFTSDKTA